MKKEDQNMKYDILELDRSVILAKINSNEGTKHNKFKVITQFLNNRPIPFTILKTRNPK